MKILKIHSLNKGYHDRDEIMLHACFQILEDCVEKEKVDTHCSYKAHKKFVDEVRFLYKWWKKRKNHKAKYGEYYELNNNDDKMLIRLMKIRTQLWT